MTALGINNNGELIFPYGKEDTDYNIDGEPSSGYIYNGATSVFWCRLRDLLANEITTTFQTAADECFSETNLINQFDAYQSCYPEEIWRLDIQRKYIRTFTGESVDNSKPKFDVQYLRDMMQGRKKYQRRQWVRDQIAYFGTKNLMNIVVGDNNRITFRCFTPTGDDVVVKPDYTLRITPSADMYVSVMFGNGDVKQKRAKAGVEQIIECPLATMDDTQVTIYGANRIEALNDLSACYIAANNFSMATKLRKLVLGNPTVDYNNSRLTSLSMGNNELLEELDIRNCKNLTGSINLEYCSNLLKLLAEGTQITGVTFATNGKIEIAHLPNTINTLIMRNLDKLVDFDAALTQLDTLTLQGGTLDSLDIVTRCINTLRVLYLYDIDWSLDNTDLLNQIMLLFHSLLAGKVHTPVIKQQQLYDYQSMWPDLEINYNTLVTQYAVTFVNHDGTVLDVQYVDKGTAPVDPITRENNPIPVPTKESTVSTSFTFAGWNTKFVNTFADTTIRATYDETIRQYTIRYASNGTELQATTANYGSIVTYDGELPTYTAEELAYKYYLFDGWDQSGYVSGDKTINAVYDSCEYKEGYFIDKELSSMRPVEVYMMTKLGLTGVINLADYIAPKDALTVQLGNDLSYSDITEEVLIADKTVFDGSNYIDTGIQLLSEDRSFVLAIDFKMNSSSNNTVLAQCFSGIDSSGFKLSYNGGPKLLWGSSSTSPCNVNAREMLVLRHIKGENGLHVYVSNTTGSSSAYIEMSGVHSMTHNVSLVFGCNKLEDGSYEEYGNGIIYWSKIWYADLGHDVCAKIADWPHESIGFEACCELNGALKRYYLSDNSGTRSSVALISSTTLTQPMIMDSAYTNTGGWAKYALNTYLNNRIYNAFSDKWKQMLKQVKVKSSVGDKSTEISSSDCYVFVPSIYELVSSMTEEPYGNEGTPISHFTSNASRICYNSEGKAVQYWTRSPSTGWSNYVYRITDTGTYQSVTQLSSTDIYVRIMIAI